jgi:hypothetical protein
MKAAGDRGLTSDRSNHHFASTSLGGAEPSALPESCTQWQPCLRRSEGERLVKIISETNPLGRAEAEGRWVVSRRPTPALRAPPEGIHSPQTHCKIQVLP